MCNLLTGVFNIAYILKKRRSDNQNKLYIDWKLSSFCIPLLITGSMIGILISNLFPSFQLLLIITTILIVVTSLTIYKMINENRA